MPLMSGIRGRAPTLMNICGAVSSSLPTTIVQGLLNLAWPKMTSMVSTLSNHLLSPACPLFITVCARPLTTFRSTSIGPPKIAPYSPALLVTAIALAEATNVLVGMHPELTHVPPRCFRSTSATLRPSAAIRAAKCPCHPTEPKHRRLYGRGRSTSLSPLSH